MDLPLGAHRRESRGERTPVRAVGISVNLSTAITATPDGLKMPVKPASESSEKVTIGVSWLLVTLSIANLPIVGHEHGIVWTDGEPSFGDVRNPDVQHLALPGEFDELLRREVGDVDIARAIDRDRRWQGPTTGLASSQLL